MLEKCAWKARTGGRAAVDAALRALAAIFAKPSSRSDLSYYRSDFHAHVVAALDALRGLPDDREPDTMFFSNSELERILF